MPDFVSKMQMHSQETPQEVVDQELLAVAGELGLDPATEMGRIAFSDEGWSSRVYLLDEGKTVFKFPRSPEVIAEHRREIAALVLLETVALPLPVQRFRASAPDGSFFSYHGLVGTQLSEQLDTLDTDAKTEIGSKIGLFLGNLHSLEMPGLPVVDIHSEVQEYQAKYRLARPVIDERLSAREQRVADEFFEDELPVEVTRLGEDVRLCHGDLGSYNVVVNAEGVPGIIDFGNIGYYDLSKDFIDFGDEHVLDAALRSYGDDPQLREKISVRTVALQAIDLVYYMSKKDAAGVEKTADKLRLLLGNRAAQVGGYAE